GAVVSFAPTATDVVDGSRPVACTPASGSTFALGTTTVTCTATDEAGNTATRSFGVTVRDTTPPSLSLPDGVLAEATGPDGAGVSFSATASDLVDGSVTPVCTPASGATFALGATTVDCTATDIRGNGASGRFRVTVVDTTPPAVVVPGDIVAEATGPDGAVVEFAVTATDLVDGPVGADCVPASESTFALGTTTVTCTAVDEAGNDAGDSFQVTVEDTTPPALSLPPDFTVEATGPAGATATYTATAGDIVDGDVAVDCSPASGATFPIDGTTVTCAAEDAAGNTAEDTFVVTVADRTPPGLHLPEDVVTEATGPDGAEVNYTVTATDLVDGPVTPSCDPASGSVFPIATTEVGCSATDSRRNTDHGTFNVTVRDTTAPELTLPGDMTVEATGPGGAAVPYAATATDIVDGDVAVTCSQDSDTTFGLGTTTVSCSATDAHDNTARRSFTVTVVDTTAPVLAIPGGITQEATGPDGAEVSWTASARDLVDGDVAVTCSPVSGSTFPLGTTTVQCSATDSRDNDVEGSFVVVVVDTTEPDVIVADVNAVATGGGKAKVEYTATASDLVDGPMTPTCTPASGSDFNVGATIVNCSATDAHGNKGTGTGTVNVAYAFNGFYRPVDNPTVLNQVKAGQAVPVRFGLGGNQGMAIFAAGHPASGPMACSSTAPVDAVDQTVTAGSSSLGYDAATATYHYVWKTDKAWAGTCRQLVLRMADGSYHRANFTFVR
ncbi:MAG: HYR domain-containing protein, partial [Acidimicrobiales bacterium]